MLIGLALVGVGASVFALLDAWPWALLGVICIGLGYGILVVAVNMLFAAGFGDRSAALLILVNACFGLGAVTGPLLYGVLSSGSFRPAFLVIGALAVLVLPLTWSIPAEVTPRERPVPVSDGHGVQLALGAFVALFLLYTGVEASTSGWMATHLIFHGFSQAAAATFTAAFWAALTIGRLLSVPVSLRLTPARMIAGALTGVIVLSLAANVTPLTPVAYVLIGLLLAPVFPVGFAWLDAALRGRPGIASMALFGALAGGLIFPVLVGRAIGSSTPDVLPPALAAIAFAGLMVSLRLPRWIQEAAEAPAPPCSQTG